MKTELLRSVDLKLERAAVQRAALSDAMHTWTTSDAISHNGEYLEGRLGFRVTIGEWKVAPPMEHWSLLVGELVHNLRSCLDNLVYALARVQQDPPVRPRQLAYPIYGDQADFDRNGRRWINQLPDEAAQLIEHIQPFQRDVWPWDDPEFHPLVMLQRLSNSDKHQLPKIAVLVPQGQNSDFKAEFFSDEDAQAQALDNAITIWGGPIKPGVVLFEFKASAPIKSIKSRFGATFVISLEEAQRAPAPEVLGNMLGHIHEVVGMFRRFFV